MRNFLYSERGDKDYTPVIIDKLAEMNVIGVIVDFEPTDNLCQRLKGGGITENYYVIKLWRKESVEELEVKIARAKDLGFEGIAIDSEPYTVGSAPVDLWVDKSASIHKGWLIGALIKKYFTTQPILYPEGTLFKNMDKYKYWPDFYKALQESGLNPTIFMERTYQQWEPWNILWFWLCVKQWAKGKVVLGVWPTDTERVKKWQAVIQMNFTKLFWDRFLYTEGMEYPDNEFYSRIAT